MHTSRGSSSSQWRETLRGPDPTDPTDPHRPVDHHRPLDRRLSRRIGASQHLTGGEDDPAPGAEHGGPTETNTVEPIQASANAEAKFARFRL